MKQLYEALAERIVKEVPVEVKKGKLIIDGVPVTKTTMATAIDLADYVDIPDLAASIISMGDGERRAMFHRLHDLLIKGADKPQSRLEKLSQLSAFQFIPATCPMTGARFLLNSTDLTISKFDYDAVVGALPSGARAAFEEDMQYAIASYDPYDLSPYKRIEMEGIDITQVNTYSPPAWRLSEPVSPDMPEVFEEFFCRLFPDAECRKYIYHWMYNAILHRNETVLVLNGVKGIGKGVFCSIMKALVGEENYTEAAVATLETQFNSILLSKRIIVFDEIEVGKKEHTRLKRYTNDRQTVELKGKDAKSSVEVFNSYIISNNDTSDMYLEVDDRRFSVAECTKVPMVQSTTPEQREALISALDDEILIGQLGHWIIANGCNDKWDTFTVFKEESFFKLVYNSLLVWQRFLVEYALEFSEPVSYSELNKQYRKISGKDSKLPSNMSKLIDFLSNYYHNGESTVGRMEKVAGEWMFYPTLRNCEEEVDL